MSIFIPETCKVGFQARKDTFTNKLAYVIYYDAKGKLRKEKSWTGWCHEQSDSDQYWKSWDVSGNPVDVSPFNFENKPTSGFVLNKGIRRYNWSHFGTGRSMIRIYDPRGIEFEITPDNLIGLLMHTDCSKREILDELVYAWNGVELMLMPCSSEEYEQAKNFTKLQGVKIGARELIEGASYVTKKEDNLVYLGRHMWYDCGSYYSDDKTRKGSKQHVFCDMEGKNFQAIKSIPSVIAAVIDANCHNQFATWLDDFLKSKESSEIVKWVKKPLATKVWDRDWSDKNWRANNLHAAVRLDGEFYTVNIKKQYDHYRNRSQQDTKTLILEYSVSQKVNKDGSMGYEHRSGEVVKDRSIFFDLYAVFENGLKMKWSKDGY